MNLVYLKTFSKSLQNLDIFGVSLSFTYATKSTYKTLFGSFLTLIISLLFFYKLIVSISDVIPKRNLTVKYEEIITEEDNIELKNLNMRICNNYAFYYNDTQFEKYYTYDVTLEKNGDFIEKIPVKICNNTSGVTFFNNKCRCLSFNDTYFYSVDKTQSLQSDLSLKLKIKMNFNFLDEDLNAKILLNDRLKLNAIKKLLIFFPKNYVNSSNYYDPIQFSPSTINMSFKKGSEMQSNLLTTRLEVNSINDILTFGIVEPFVDTYNSFTFDNQFSTIFENDDSNLGIISVFIKHSACIKKYSINSFNLDDLLAIFGGYFQVFFVIFNFISMLVNEAFFENYIEERFKKKFHLIKDVLEEIEKYSQIKNNFNIEENYNINDYAENKLNENSEKSNGEKKLNYKFHTEDVVSINSERLRILKDNSLIKYNNSYEAIQNLFKINKSKITHNKEDCIVKVSKSYDKKYYKNLKEEFKNCLDFEIYYDLIKEIKLIEFILFDYETLSILTKIKEIPFSVEKLKEFVNNKMNIISRDEIGNNNFRDLYGLKIKLLKEFLEINK